jgi:hypothetical protein
MLRAARKAMSRVNPTKLEAAGRRAVERLENLDARKVSELGKKAAKNLDPRRIEEIAEEAGRELIHVIERVAERVESAVAGAPPRSKSAPPPAPEHRSLSRGDGDPDQSNRLESLLLNQHAIFARPHQPKPELTFEARRQRSHGAAEPPFERQADATEQGPVGVVDDAPQGSGREALGGGRTGRRRETEGHQGNCPAAHRETCSHMLP